MKFFLFWFSWLCLLRACFAGDGSFSFELVVVDDQGNPVEEAMVEHAFISESLPSDKQKVVLFTGSDGVCQFSGVASDLGRLRITKKGWYTNIEKLSPFFSRRRESGGDWTPLGKVVRTVFKTKGESVPMYAKKEKILVPKNFVSEQRLGYDLEIGDWVAPFGKGKREDFIFSWRMDGESERDFKWKLVLEFSNPGDGIQSFDSVVGMDDPAFRGSELRSPKSAPIFGYKPKIEWKFTGSESRETCRNFLHVFRVRTVLGEGGKIVEAKYGKIYGNPIVDRFFKKADDGSQNKIDGLIFNYYFNPNGTPNLEFDTERNLLLNLPPERSVRVP